MASKTYPSTLSGLRDRVWNRLLSSSTAKHSATNEKIRAAINDAQREIQNELMLAFDSRYFTKIDTNLTPANNRIRLPEDFKRLVTFDRDGGTNNWVEVNLVPVVQYQRYQTSPYPRSDGNVIPSWSMVGDSLIAHGSGTASGRFRLIYSYQIKDLMSDDDVSEIPEDYQEMLVDYAAWMMEEDAGNEERANRLFQRYDRRLQQMRRTSRQLSMVTQRRIRNVRGIGLR